MLSNTVGTAKKCIRTSTFQCLILPLKLINSFYNGSFNFTSQKLSVLKQIYVSKTNKTKYYYPNEKCKEGSCLSSFNSEKGYHVNITMISVNSTMCMLLNCLYAGLYVGEELLHGIENRKYTRKITSNNNGAAFSFYSNNSSLILFMYWYKEISKINASVMVSQTKCESYVYNPCYFKDISYHRFSGIDFAEQSDHTFEYTLKKYCVIIIVSNTQPELTRDCSILLVPTHSVDVQVRFVRYQEDFDMSIRMLHLRNINHAFLGKYSEPTVPRFMERVILDINGYTESLLYGIYLLQDAVFHFSLNSLLSRSRIELLIERGEELLMQPVHGT